jgi:hypothetical protein
MKYLLILYLIIGLSMEVTAQQAYRIMHFSSSHNCFPDTARANGHLDGDSIQQPFSGHYDDSSVLLVVPQGLDVSKTVDLVFWFHGWHNNIDTALRFYGLADQFAASGRNAVLVLPEAAKNAADSYGGKMRQEGMFNLLVADVVDALRREGIVPAGAAAGHVVLAGHSGAYSVMADILNHGRQPVDEVFLFDALYGRVPIYLNWAVAEPHHFVHWFTNTGYGPDKMSDTMMLALSKRRVDFGLCEEASVSADVLRGSRILFVHSPREHNVIINHPDDFALLLRNSFFLKGGGSVSSPVSIKEIHIKSPMGDLVYPLIVSGDTSVSGAMNRAIAEQVLPDEEGSVRARIGRWIKEDKLSDLSYTVTFNVNGILSLHVHSEEGGGPLIEREIYLNFFTQTGKVIGIEDLISGDRLDSFQRRVLADKRHYLEEYMKNQKEAFESRKIDSDAYDKIRETVSDCMGAASLADFSLSNKGLEIIDRCEMDGVSYRSLEPGYSLFYLYKNIEGCKVIP